MQVKDEQDKAAEVDPFDEAIAEDEARTKDEWAEDEAPQGDAAGAAPDAEVTIPEAPAPIQEPAQTESTAPVDAPPAAESVPEEPPREEHPADPGAQGMTYEQAVSWIGGDYGEEFIAAIEAIVRHAVCAEAGKIGGETNSRLDQAISAVQEAFQNIHFETLRALRSNVDEVSGSPEFSAYIEGLPEADRVVAQGVIASGRLHEVVKLIDAFDEARKAAEQGEPDDDDDWDGVKSMPAMPASISSDDPNDFGDDAEWGRDVLKLRR